MKRMTKNTHRFGISLCLALIISAAGCAYDIKNGEVSSSNKTENDSDIVDEGNGTCADLSNNITIEVDVTPRYEYNYNENNDPIENTEDPMGSINVVFKKCYDKDVVVDLKLKDGSDSLEFKDGYDIKWNENGFVIPHELCKKFVDDKGGASINIGYLYNEAVHKEHGKIEFQYEYSVQFPDDNEECSDVRKQVEIPIEVYKECGFKLKVLYDDAEVESIQPTIKNDDGSSVKTGKIKENSQYVIEVDKKGFNEISYQFMYDGKQADGKDGNILIEPNNVKDKNLSFQLDKNENLIINAVANNFVEGNRKQSVRFVVKPTGESNEMCFFGYDFDIIDTTDGSTVYQIDEFSELNNNMDGYLKDSIKNEKCSSRLVLPPGKYKLEAWGASGGDAHYNKCGDNKNIVCDSYDNYLVNISHSSFGGLGGYSVGTIDLEEKETTVYLYYGTHGSEAGQGKKSGGCNGGGNGGRGDYIGFGGGGAADVRLDIDDIYYRILVAGGGGGADDIYGEGHGGYGGGIIAEENRVDVGRQSQQATQVTGSAFGYAEDYNNSGDIGGGGGGWFGGFHGSGLNAGGGGGSGFVLNDMNINNILTLVDDWQNSGNKLNDNEYKFLFKLLSAWYPPDNYDGSIEGCFAECENFECIVNSTGCVGRPKCIIEQIGKCFVDKTDKIIYRLQDKDFKTMSGNETFPSPYGNEETGHWGNGAIRITRIVDDKNDATNGINY